MAGVTPTESEEDHDHEHEDEDEESGAYPATPSPTESAGCEPHGDHWHCDRPATAPGAAVAANNATSPSANGTTPVAPFEGAGSSLHGLSTLAVAGIAGTVGLLMSL